ncbi:DUF397 domain-containing protein [Streptomyces sp. NPDC018057]|uniref:DUF397 domain-containing protein n=1 Tax=unclassified Streptomyces TaxID=2593676 RepID=UPI0037B0E84C
MNYAAVTGESSRPVWFKSSYSSGPEGDSCVEVALDWFKSSYSDGNEGDSCLEIATAAAHIHVRDSKHAPGGGPQVAFAATAWADFVPYATR